MVKLYVDDLTIAACGVPQRIIAIMIQVIDFVVEELEVRLLMEVSAKKSKVLAGRPSIAVAVAVALCLLIIIVLHYYYGSPSSSRWLRLRLRSRFAFFKAPSF